MQDARRLLMPCIMDPGSCIISLITMVYEQRSAGIPHAPCINNYIPLSAHRKPFIGRRSSFSIRRRNVVRISIHDD
jgi:hypothetical protein